MSSMSRPRTRTRRAGGEADWARSSRWRDKQSRGQLGSYEDLSRSCSSDLGRTDRATRRGLGALDERCPDAPSREV